VPYRHAGLPQVGQRGELGDRPLLRDQVHAEGGAALDGAHVAGAAQPAAFEVTGVAVEAAVLVGAIALGGHGDLGAGLGRDPP
jgi:hypothetical protein